MPFLRLNVCFSFRDLLPSTEMTATADPRQIHIASHLGPTVPQHSSMPNLLSNRIYPGPGSEALPAAQPCCPFPLQTMAGAPNYTPGAGFMLLLHIPMEAMNTDSI